MIIKRFTIPEGEDCRNYMDKNIEYSSDIRELINKITDRNIRFGLTFKEKQEDKNDKVSTISRSIDRGGSVRVSRIKERATR